MKDINLKDQDVLTSEDSKQLVSSDQEGCACSAEFGCKNCTADNDHKED